VAGVEEDVPVTTHVALLRGINVAGRPTVPMVALKGTFERLGLDPVRTYINSGNVLFTAPAVNTEQLTQSIEAAIAADFGFPVGVLVRTAEEVAKVADSVPENWVHDGTMKCDVFFLWPGIDRPSVLDDVPHNPAIEDLRYVPGAFVRRIDRPNINRSPLTRMVGTDLYRQMTVRNINTVRKLRDLTAAG
jgi:uncharacterized protein (DUF1697 family)